VELLDRKWFEQLINLHAVLLGGPDCDVFGH
jgi:hypothetical protein